MATPHAIRVLESHARNYRHTWRGSAVSTFLTPVLYLAAIGVGLGALVDAGPGGDALGDLDYLTWLTPGLLAAATMQTGFNDSAWPVMAGIKWRKTYQATLATPIGVTDVVTGHLGWVAIRVLMTATVFAAVGVAFGALSWRGAVAVVLPGLLTGLAFAGPVLAFTASLKKEIHLSSLQRFGIVPMFLFSGTFFPVDRLPDVVEPLAYATPLWHGVELARWAALGEAATFSPFVHAAVLVACLVAGGLLGVRYLTRRLVQ